LVELIIWYFQFLLTDIGRVDLLVKLVESQRDLSAIEYRSR